LTRFFLNAITRAQHFKQQERRSNQRNPHNNTAGRSHSSPPDFPPAKQPEREITAGEFLTALGAPTVAMLAFDLQAYLCRF
jgi:hypothetical protein